ncbi:multidrug ABC transporter ATP-binding protein [Candidatus Epulonipiscium fishelsonii]|uniref:Multidrug ABC transporter ATP-binding protein n=1 Tax=Candidatus Epulonipiscium fishelsonii TaxID=77094 RepID=A0ACC8XH95_9FIRM|nr:multidrug ABC transporter ATP-binding protein [Epulopiscium sp. SCG-B05WGA-EpuloA1]ONI43028.1 multidrug ABC transporter ATP-binding protein [Epulopiscium sp. SCG-B11WGA-EpuloA1]
MYIKFENVSKKFKQEEVLVNINFKIDKGKTYGFVGRNGSGKTVIFKLLSGLILPTSGNIYVNDVNLTKTKQFPQNMGILIETPGFIPHYSGLKNLKILNDLSDFKVSVQKIKESMSLVGLDPENRKHLRTYSLGMKQKLGIAQAIMNEPELLILDEPMNGLDEDSVLKMREFFNSLKQKQVTTLLASHNKEDISSLCDKIFYIKSGNISENDI